MYNLWTPSMQVAHGARSLEKELVASTEAWHRARFSQKGAQLYCCRNAPQHQSILPLRGSREHREGYAGKRRKVRLLIHNARTARSDQPPELQCKL